MIQQLAIVGLGLLGGSVAKAARARRLARMIVAVGRDEAKLRPAQAAGTVDRVTTDLAAGVRDADFVVLAVPVLDIERLLEPIARAVGGGPVVTDVGSTKARIAAEGVRLGAVHPLQFVGSHPMAGSERSGYEVSRANLFEGAAVIVTPSETTADRLTKEVTAFWEALGARVSILDPLTHDRVMAAVSHLPHLVADALVEGARRFEPAALEFAAAGFKDTTRIAASNPAMWRDIFLANRDALLASVGSLRGALDELGRLIEAGDGAALERWLAAVKAARDQLR